MENADVFLGLHDFLERMRKPTAADFVKSIKSFIVSFSNNPPDPEKDSASIQEFFSKMEAAFRVHPLWSGCSEEELESAGEGLEKYVMTKLFTRVFASAPEDAKYDEQLSEKMALIQQFIHPENLDIQPTYQNETSWLLAQKELQKINMYKAPRDKLVCILNCCKVINNLLLNASIASNVNTPGADEFLPVLIYVTIKANPPQLRSNLLYIQRYRRQSRLVGEAAYFFTNMLSAESFISNIDAKALSMEDSEYEKNMEFARALLSGLDSQSNNQTDQTESMVSKSDVMNSKKEGDLTQSKSSEKLSRNKDVPHPKDELGMAKALSLPDLESKGASMLLSDRQESKVFEEYPFLFAQVGDLTISDVEELLNNYKQLVFKYVCLSKGLNGVVPSFTSSSPAQVLQHAETNKQPAEFREVEQDIKSRKDTPSIDDDSSDKVLQVDKENVIHNLPSAEDGDANSYGKQVDDKGSNLKALPAQDEEVDSKGPQAEVADVGPEDQVLKEDVVGSELPHSENENSKYEHPNAEDQDSTSK